ncbi:hypothetical protein D3C80_821600 [compost metagenome]
MFFQDLFLLRARRKVTVEIQAAFAHRTHSRLLEKSPQALGGIAVPVTGAMGVDTGRTEQALACFVELLAQL